MNTHQSREDLIFRQERAAKQQELLEKKRKIKAEKDRDEKKRDIRRNAGPKLPGKGVPGSAPGLPAAGRVKEKRRMMTEGGESSVTQWFLSICWIKIPLIGFLYAVFLAVYPKAAKDKKSFARGYLIYRALVDILSITVIYMIYQIGLDFVDQILAFVQ